MKKILSVIGLLLVFALLFSACNAAGNKEELSTTDLSYIIDERNNCAVITGRGSCSDLHIVIPSSIAGYRVTKIANYAFEKDDLESIAIPGSVVSIEEDAFKDCDKLKSVYITDIAKWCAISFGNDYANPLYYACKLYLNGELVINLAIPDGVGIVEKNAFYNCTKLTSITIPSSVKSIGENAFYGCTSLETIDVAEGNPVYHSSGNCIIETESKTLIFGCKKSYIPHNGSVTRIGDHAFFGCTSLTFISIPDSVTIIGDGAFSGCTSLGSVLIGDSVKSIGFGAFMFCSALDHITIPDSVTSIGAFAFALCTDLTWATFENTKGWYVTVYGSNKDITIGSGSTNAKKLSTEYSGYYWYRK